MVVQRQHICGEVHSVAAVPATLSILALHGHPVGGATVQGLQLEYSVHWQEARAGEGGGEGGGAICQAAPSQPKHRNKVYVLSVCLLRNITSPALLL